MRKEEAAWIRTLKSLVVFHPFFFFFKCIYLTNFFFADCFERSKFDKKNNVRSQKRGKIKKQFMGLNPGI